MLVPVRVFFWSACVQHVWGVLGQPGDDWLGLHRTAVEERIEVTWTPCTPRWAAERCVMTSDLADGEAGDR